MSRFAVLDIPQNSKKIDDVTNHRNIFDSHFAALYHPWLEVFDPLDKKNIAIPPSGSVAGIYARSDNTRGVHKAPANEVVRACTGLDCQYNKGEQDILNPKGVNLIRVFPGQGIRVWGARTCSSNSLWKYVNVRRLFIFIEESIKANTNWVVFEPNDEMLWTRVKRTIDVFLENVWKSGALMGGSPNEAFYVDVGRSTMSQDDIDNGRLICVIGVAPVKPAEFVIFRITQKTASE
jgi:phage tail sheath protein FI